MIYNSWMEGDSVTLVHTINGKIKKETVKFRPSLYYPCKKGEEHNSKYKSIHGKPLSRKIFRDVFTYQASLAKAKKNNDEIYGDLKPIYQYIINKFLNRDIQMDDTIRAYNYDIEAFRLDTDEFQKPEFANGPVQSITIEEMHTGKYYVLGYKDYEVTDVERIDNNGIKHIVKAENIKYIKCKTEIQLLRKFVAFLKNKDVQVLTGWNILNYDNQYIINRLRRLGIEEEFVNSAIETREGIHFARIQNLDYYHVLKKIEPGNRPSYKLNDIIYDECGFNKIDMKDGFRKTYINDFKNFIDYNIVDVMAVQKIDDKLQYIKLLFFMCNIFRCLPSDILNVTQYWDTKIFSYALERNLIVNQTKETPKLQYIGGYVKKPITGLADWSTLYDIESSYPTNNRIHNISPEMLVEYDKLPRKIYNMVEDLLFYAVKKVYDKHKNTYKTESGSKSVIMPGKPIPDNKYNVLYMHDKNGYNTILDKIQYPHFFVIEHNSLLDEYKDIDKCKRIDNNKYLYFCESKKDIINKCRKEFKGYSKINIFNNLYISKWLVNYFVEDVNRFEKFTPLLQKHKLIITPILQFFKKTNELGILPKTQEMVFFDRKKAKKAKVYDGICHTVASNYLDNNMKVDKESFKNLGINILPDDYKKELITTLKTKDNDKINLLVSKFKSLEVTDAIMDKSLKVGINGAYGATASEWFRFCDVRLSEATTSTAQLALRGVSRYLEQKELVIYTYSDTDSSKFSYNGLKYGDDDKENYTMFKDYFVNEVDPVIEEYYEKLRYLCNTRDVKIKLEREVIIKKSLFTAKKRYFWWLYELDGRVVIGTKDEFKDRGLDTRRSDTPKWVSNKLDKFLKYVIKGKDEEFLRNYVKTAKKFFMKLPIDQLAKPSSVSKLNDYKEGLNTKGIQSHYRGVFGYLDFLDKYDKENKYEKITAGEKIKWCYIKPNKEFNVSSIAIPVGDYNKDILDHIEIDYEKQFNVTFMGLVNQVFDACGWEFEKKNKLF